MAGSTRYYGLAFFDFNDPLDSDLNVEKEIDRFVLIDKQIYGLYSIFGNGVIDGWNVSDNGFSPNQGIAARVSPGIGIIRNVAAETTFPIDVTGLTPNATNNIYAVLQGSTVRDRRIDFIAENGVLDLESTLLVARVDTGGSAILSINNTVRDRISFEQTIEEEVNNHKHRGTPSRIDLRRETKNQLPGARITDLDASKITSGTLDPERLPIINHEDLQFNGLLTHPQLDSFVNTLNENNKELLGEVSTINLLKHILFMKYKYSDIDEHFVNELALVPGISPDEHIDYDSTTANIDSKENCISGTPAKTGEFVDVDFSTEFAFQNAHDNVNLEIDNNSVRLQRDQTAIEMIEDFENAQSDEEELPQFSKETNIVVDDISVQSENTDSLKLSGFYSGRFDPRRSFRAVFTKTFSTPRDWTDFDQLTVNVKTLTDVHGPVFAYFVNGEGDAGKKSSNFLILSEDEVTSSSDASRDNFEAKKFDILPENRDQVSKFVIFTNDTSDGFRFYLDEIFVQNTSLFKPQGTIRFRHSTGVPVTYHSVFYDVDRPEDTKVLIRIKTANSTTLLTRSSFTLPLRDGEVFARRGTDAEIEVTLLTNDRTVTPTLNSLKLRMVVDSNVHGFNIDEDTEWSRGVARNISIENTSGHLAQIQMEDPIDVGGRYFSLRDAIHEIDKDDSGVFGFSGVRLLKSVPQAADWHNNPTLGFNKPVSVMRQFDKEFLIADMDNDRVVLTDEKGKLIKGFGGVHKADDILYPYIAVFNPTNDVFTIVFSKTIDPNSVDLSRIAVLIGSARVPFNETDEIISSDKNDQILEIKLSTDKAAQMKGVKSAIFLSLESNVVAQTLEGNANSSALTGIRGLEVDIADFTFIDQIRHPVFADILDDGSWIIANSSVIEGEESEDDSQQQSRRSRGGRRSGRNNSGGQGVGEIPDVVAFDPDLPEDIVYSNTDIKFSDFSLGSIAEMDSGSLVIAGIRQSDTSIDSSSDDQEESFDMTIFYENTINGDLTNAFHVELGNTDGYGLRESNGGVVIADDGTSVSHPSTGRYEFTFEATEGTSYEVSWKVTQNKGDDPTFVTEEFQGSKGEQPRKSRAEEALQGYRGAVIIVDPYANRKTFEYTSPDGLFASDVRIAPDGNLVIAESSFASNNGRIIKLDNDGNIIFQYGQGRLGIVNDVSPLDNGNFLISV